MSLRLPILVAVLVLATSAPLRALPAEDPGDEWIRVDTAHLVLFSDASRNATVEIGRQMELYRVVLARLGPDLSPDSPLPTFVFLFKNELAFTPYKLRQKGRHAGMPANVDGFFVQHRDGNYIGVNATPDSSPWPVIYHEFFHFFLHNNFEDIPLWFDEGMAQCYATFRLDGGRVVIGGPIPEKIAWLREHPLMPLARLQAITFDSPDYHEEGKQETFYSQSWATVHYLLWGPARPAGGGVGFLHDLKRGGSLQEALALLAPAKDPALAQPVADMVRKGRFAFSEITLESLKFDDGARVRTIGRDEVLYRLGDFLLHTDADRVREVEDHLHEALRLNPGLAAAQTDLGQALEARGLRPEAHAAFEKAIALDPTNHALALPYAYALIDEAIPPGETEVRPEKGMPPEIARARGLFQAATAAAPDVAEAWAGLGSTYLYEDKDLAPGIAALERAWRLLPTRLDVAHNLAELYAQSGQRGRAQDLIDRVLERAEDPAMRAAGESILFRGDLAGVEALVAKGDTAGAVERLRALQAGALSPQQKSIVEARLRDIEQFAGQKSALGQYNAAVARANAQEYDAAVAILEQLLAAGGDPDLMAQARELLAQMRDVQTVNRAMALARGGDYARATAMLQKVARETRDPKIARQAREMAANVAANGETSEYNRALDKFKGKDYAGAIAILDRLIAGTKDADLAARARDLRGWAKQAMAEPPAQFR